MRAAHIAASVIESKHAQFVTRNALVAAVPWVLDKSQALRALCPVGLCLVLFHFGGR